MSSEEKQESSSDDAAPAASQRDVEMKKETEPSSKPKVKDENSIEYWNEQRAKLGMKPLKEKEPTEVDSRQVTHPPPASRDQDLYKSARRRDKKRRRRRSSSSYKGRG